MKKRKPNYLPNLHPWPAANKHNLFQRTPPQEELNNVKFESKKIKAEHEQM